MTIPTPLDLQYRIATSREIRRWSFGALSAARQASATMQDHVRGTLHDQAIFGPVHDFQCGCGKYQGRKHEGMICDLCGVKIAASTIRSSRFGHIEMTAPIGHPLAPAVKLQCFPVIPITFLQSPGGAPLAKLYEQLVDAADNRAADDSRSIVAAIIDHLTPIAIRAHHWRLADAKNLARGLGLEVEGRDAKNDVLESCARCGYPLAGLRVQQCPGCGAQSN